MDTADIWYLSALITVMTLAVVALIYHFTMLFLRAMDGEMRRLHAKLDAVLAQIKDAHVSSP